MPVVTIISLQDYNDYVLDKLYDDVNDIYDEVLGEPSEKLIKDSSKGQVQSSIKQMKNKGVYYKMLEINTN